MLHVTYNSLSHSILGSNTRSGWFGAPKDRPDVLIIHEMFTIRDIDEGGNLVSAMQLMNPIEIPVPNDLVMPEGHTHVYTCDIVAIEDLTQFPPTMTPVWTANTPNNPLGNNQAAGQQPWQWWRISIPWTLSLFDLYVIMQCMQSLASAKSSSDSQIRATPLQSL